MLPIRSRHDIRVLSVFFIGAAAITSALAGPVFTNVINSSSGVGAPYDSFRIVKVNEAGTLVFAASNDGTSATTGESLVTLSSSGTLTVLANSPSSTTTSVNEIRSFELVDINNAGTVAVRALYGGSTSATRPRGILTFAPGGGSTVIVRDADGANPPAGPYNGTMGGPSINSNGDVLYNVAYDTTALGRELRLAPGTGGPSILVADTVSTATVEGWNFSGFSTGQQVLRDNRDIIAYFNYRRSGGLTSTLGQDSVYYYDSAAGQFRTLLDDTDDVGHTGPFKQYTSIFNANVVGDFAVSANNSDTGQDWVVYYEIGAGTFRIYADDTGPYDRFIRPLTTDSGTVVFEAVLDDASTGIFYGPDPATQKLIKVGETLFGGTVTDLTLYDVIEADDTVYFVYAVDLTADGLADVIGIASTVIPPPADLTGDMNCDSAVDFDDIEFFVVALVSQAAYEAALPDCRWLNGDADGDGDVDFDDINGFVQCIIGGGC